MTKITEGVDLHTIETTQFKTVSIVVEFKTRLDKNKIDERSLLAAIMGNSAEKFPDPAELSRELYDMYGASYHVSTVKTARNLNLRFVLNTINGSYANDRELLKKSFAFLNEVIHNPLIDEPTLMRERANLVTQIKSLADDKKNYAINQGAKLFFKDAEVQGLDSYGQIENLEKLTIHDLEKAHAGLKDELVNIFVVGDVDPKEVESYIEEFDFKSRNKEEREYLYEREASPEIEIKTEIQDVAQAKVVMFANFPGVYASENHYASLVFNALYGGSVQGRLFRNVREKESLAYSIFSSIDLFRKLLFVYGGVDNEKTDYVQEVIIRELVAMKNGDTTEANLHSVKKKLINDYEIALDSPASLLNHKKFEVMNPDFKRDLETYTKGINAVTLADVAGIADKVRFDSAYVLKGGANK
ncbi:MAG: insulinase family protein [Lactobacillales bacterium]|nr:insulinase family protein [Lactobacillales bacterium]